MILNKSSCSAFLVTCSIPVMYNILPENKFSSGGETLVIFSSKLFTAKVSPAMKPVVFEDDPEIGYAHTNTIAGIAIFVKSKTIASDPLPPVTDASKGIDVYGVPGSNDNPSVLLIPSLCEHR